MALEKKQNSMRKKEHLFVSLNEDVEATEISNGFKDYRFIHQALPGIALEEIDVSTTFLGKKLELPMMISPLVGGINQTGKINKDLAKVAQLKGIAMGLGSQRTAIEDNGNHKSYLVRDVAPDILLFSNLGAVQLNYGFGVKECSQAVKMVDADALIIHLNLMQEAFQAEGNCNFRGLEEKIGKVCNSLDVPVLVREVGFGISREVAKKLVGINVSAIDVGGAGGTSWVEVEKHRSKDRLLKKVAPSFNSWGIPTADSVKAVRSVSETIPLVASGGIRTGLEVAKAIALGADIAGIALPMLRNIRVSVKSCIDYINEIKAGLKIAMFGIGAARIDDLKHTPFITKGEK
ncbi:MAG: type 2 isopentenyl-diphosphate Delta-isomerase [Candidatus Humimicrobiaceae bacterium]